MSTEGGGRIRLSGIISHKAILLLRNFELILFPSYCRLCSAFLADPEEKIICRSCWEYVKPEKSPYCLSCGRFFEGAGEPHLCALCLQDKPPFHVQRSFGRYGGPLKDIILLGKFHSLPVLADGLAQRAYAHLRFEEALWWNLDALIPVPLHPKKEKVRGYNFAQIIAQKFARLSGFDVLEKKLIKIKNTPPQMSLTMADRSKSVKGAFAVRKREEIEDKVILLVDDVYTTGATVRECALVLMKAGAGEVRVVTVAQA
ncbi:MAG: ComF family protein [Candidatus Aminicenantes bacterium]|nr:ComF family protein [Candidatus Aminicenantes bacterium]